ncbi:uncharacterized protein FIBRA_00980 [Fibroporia radiculosa]|uniref:Peptidase S26 domain-containing protein n=1 Tax=Fibroporia radiculosa TaxID=599839 RepID=J4HSK2_9APHY|nr:uncharacterized protein FIBRA_00980 [Fibroporia radiculosa]CCL98972.1 predicted protein [Fibroporia radiculosa]
MLNIRLAQVVRDVSRRLRDKPWGNIARSTGLKTLHLINIACAAHLFVEHVGWVAGPSMLPTMSVTGESVLENRMVSPENLQRGDLVTITSPLNPTRIVCKRILGLPGDVICVDPTGTLAPSTEHVLVPKNHIWLSGDNAAFSRDSRTYGPVSMALVRGRLVARVWPPSKFTVFRNNFNFID